MWAVILKKYWKELVLILLGIIISVILSVLYFKLNARNKEISALKTSIAGLETSLTGLKQSQKSIENLMKAQADILISIQNKETVAEKVFTEKIIDNSRIVEKWINNPEDKTASDAFYKARNSSWQDMYEPWEEEEVTP